MCLSQTKVMRSIVVIAVLLCFGIVYAQDNSSDVDQMDNLSLEDLIDLKVTVASKVEESISDAPGVISVITQDELKRFGGTTLADVLKRVPSFLGSTVYMTDRSMVASRGDQIMPSSSHILLLINGRPMREIHEAGIKSEVLESFPVSVIERIEVIRGPGSVLYGSQAVSAVINVVTKSPENNTVSLSGNLGEGGKYNVMADLQYKFGDFGLVFAGRFADKQKWKTQWSASADIPGFTSGVVNDIDIAIPDYGPGFYGELSWKGLQLMGSYNQWNSQNYVPLYEWLYNIPSDLPPEHPLSPMRIEDHVSGRIEWKKYFADLGYEHTFTEWYNASVNVTYTKSLFKTWNFPFTSRNSYEVLGELANFFTPVENLNIVAGGLVGYLTGFEENSKGIPDWNDGIYNKDHKGLNFSGYLQTDYRWEWCKIIGGLQVNKVRFTDSLDHVDDFDADFNPRAGLILYPIENINIKALYSTAYRAPSLNELYMDYSVISGKMTRRDDPKFATWDHEYTMEPEKVHTFDVGVNYQDDRVQFGLNGFHTRMKNLISQVYDTTRYTVGTWDNIGEITIFGLECEGRYYLTNAFLVEGSILYQYSKDKKTGDENVTPLPNFSAKGGLSYRSEFGLTVSAFNTFQEALDPKYGSDKLNKITEYFNMTHLHFSYDFNKRFKFSAAKDLSLVVHVDNLLDEEIWLPCWGLSQQYTTIPYYPGRTIYGGFKVAF